MSVIASAVAGILSALATRGSSSSSSKKKPTSIKLPCATESGALQDYIFVVVGYRVFAGTKGGVRCFDFFPAELQLAHTRHIEKIIKYLRDEPKYGPEYLKSLQTPGKWSGRSFTAPEPLGWCTSALDALNDYERVVLNYDEYSGSGCWKGKLGIAGLPKFVRNEHKTFALKTRPIMQKAKQLQIDRQKQQLPKKAGNAMYCQRIHPRTLFRMPAFGRPCQAGFQMPLGPRNNHLFRPPFHSSIHC